MLSLNIVCILYCTFTYTVYASPVVRPVGYGCKSVCVIRSYSICFLTNGTPYWYYVCTCKVCGKDSCDTVFLLCHAYFASLFWFWDIVSNSLAAWSKRLDDMMSQIEKMNRSRRYPWEDEGYEYPFIFCHFHSTSEEPELIVTPASNDQGTAVYTHSGYQRADDCLGLFLGEFNACGPML